MSSTSYTVEQLRLLSTFVALSIRRSGRTNDVVERRAARIPPAVRSNEAPSVIFVAVGFFVPTPFRTPTATATARWDRHVLRLVLLPVPHLLQRFIPIEGIRKSP